MTIMIPTWVNGELTPVEKLEAHEKGLRHKAVSVFVMNGEHTLLQQRALSKYHTPGLWANTCCTHPDWDETSLDCVNRRLNEELGIKNLSPIYRDTVEYRADVGGGLTEHEVVDIYTADTTADMPMALKPDEVAAVEWVKISDLIQQTQDTPERFTPWLRIYLREYADRIFG